MDKPISVGDLVVVVRWPCCGANIGAFRTVSEIDTGSVRCAHCNTVYRSTLCSHDGTLPAGTYPAKIVPVEWLKRIPPLDELDEVKRDEEITA